jgi:hypothetical protein
MPASFGSFLAGQEKNMTALYSTEMYIFYDPHTLIAFSVDNSIFFY